MGVKAKAFGIIGKNMFIYKYVFMQIDGALQGMLAAAASGFTFHI